MLSSEREPSSSGTVGRGVDIIRTSDWTRNNGIRMDTRLCNKVHTMEVGGHPWERIYRLVLSNEIINRDLVRYRSLKRR